MQKILFIDACARNRSRTRALAEHLLRRLPGEITRISLNESCFPQLNEARIDWRTACSRDQQFDDPSFDPAKQFARADVIVIAAPFWDLSFPSVLKQYLEAISVLGITFRYTETGIPQGLCRAKKLYYVTTAGGFIPNEEFGFGYIRALAAGMFGIADAQCFKAEGLDIRGTDVDAVLAQTQKEIDQAFT